MTASWLTRESTNERASSIARRFRACKTRILSGRLSYFLQKILIFPFSQYFLDKDGLPVRGQLTATSNLAASGMQPWVCKSGPAHSSAHHREAGDRKSTRLNSSHLGISYAVFCLKK